MLPPRRVHLSPAAAAANRSAATTSRPSASASVNAPWNTSPAPRVSIASTANTGLWRKAAPANAVALLARERGQHPVAVPILAGRTAERAGQRRASPEPRHRDRGVGSAAAIDDEKTLRLGFCVRLRKAIDPEHLVEHDDARAQDRARVITRLSGTQPLPPPRRA